MTKDQKNAQAEAAVEAFSKTEQFLKKYGNLLLICIIALIVGIAGYFAWEKFINQPKLNEAAEMTVSSENAFIYGDYETAVNGDGDIYGINQIIEEYGKKAPKAVELYAGISELQLGNWELAIEHLKKYEGEEPILKARALACIGHANVELENYETALSNFAEAAEIDNTSFAANILLNAGLVAEKLGKNDQALAFYKKIADQYPGSAEAQEIDKYIGRVENK